MSLIGAGVGLRNICIIERDANMGTPDSWGNPSLPDWQPHAEVKCNAWTQSGMENVTAKRIVGLNERMVAMPLGTDVEITDRVSAVTFCNGDRFWDGPMNIRSVQIYSEHLELTLEEVR